MTQTLTVAPRREFQSFHDVPISLDLDTLDADVAILGIPYGDPYTIDDVTNDQTNAPTAIRRHCERALRGIDRWDFDLGGTLFDGRDITVVDCGDVYGDQRLRERLSGMSAQRSAREIRDTVLGDVWSFKGDGVQLDDITVVVAKVR